MCTVYTLMWTTSTFKVRFFEMAEKPYHHGDLKHALIDAAIAVLREGNEDDLSMREIAKRVGVSPNAPYRHFKDKATLLQCVAERGFRELSARFRNLPTAPPERWLEGLGTAYYEFSCDHPAEFRVMFEQNQSDERIEGLEEASGEAFFYLLRAIQSLLPEGTTQTQAVPSALSAWAMIHGYTSLMHHNAFRFVDESIVPTQTGLAQFLVRAIKLQASG